MERFTAHGGDITHGAAEGFPADADGVVLRQIVDSLDYAIGLQKQELPRTLGRLHHRTIVTRTSDNISALRQTRQQDLQKSILVQIADLHFINPGQRRVATMVRELNNACMRMGAQRDAVNS